MVNLTRISQKFFSGISFHFYSIMECNSLMFPSEKAMVGRPQPFFSLLLWNMNPKHIQVNIDMRREKNGCWLFVLVCRQLSTLTRQQMKPYASFVYPYKMRIKSAEQCSNGQRVDQNLVSHCWTYSHSQLSKSLWKSSSLLCALPGFGPLLVSS